MTSKGNPPTYASDEPIVAAPFIWTKGSDLMDGRDYHTIDDSKEKGKDDLQNIIVHL